MTEYKELSTKDIYLFFNFAINQSNGERIVVCCKKGTSEFYAWNIKEFQKLFKFMGNKHD